MHRSYIMSNKSNCVIKRVFSKLKWHACNEMILIRFSFGTNETTVEEKESKNI